jgi:putative phosphoribosyl transferase
MAGTTEARAESRPVQIQPFGLNGDLTEPRQGMGIVLFAHGSGSSRLSPRNRYVAEAVHEAGLGTLLFDLLTDAEAADRRNVFDIPLLASRLAAATRFVRQRSDLEDARIGYFGASTGAAAALVGSTMVEEPVHAIVSRGGRPDMAGNLLPEVTAPTLLIVGSLDDGVIDLNEEAYALLTCEKRLEIVPGAGHLFEEPGTLDIVIRLARDWFTGHLGQRSGGGR